MTLKKDLENRVRGWIPKEHDLPRFHIAIAPTKKIKSNYKLKFPFVGALMLIFFALMAFSYLLAGNAVGAVFIWFSCILGFSVGSDIMVQRCKELNEQFMMGLLLGVVTLGGLIVNLYVFSTPTSTITRGLALFMLIVGNIPLLTAITAHALGKKELSKKLLGWFVLQR